jgi:hypothetical protein
MQVLPLKEKCAVPSRTSRWYACQYHRTCRSSLSHCELLCHSCVRVGLLTTGGGRLAGVDVADNDDVDVSLLLTASVVSMMLVMMQGSASSLWAASQVPGLRGAYPMVAVLYLKLKVEGKV